MTRHLKHTLFIMLAILVALLPVTCGLVPEILTLASCGEHEPLEEAAETSSEIAFNAQRPSIRWRGNGTKVPGPHRLLLANERRGLRHQERRDACVRALAQRLDNGLGRPLLI